ncbi:MAG: response regulator transcription factor [Gammaproteobacteria bacterium]|nr:response regulator transcription factor [Gammaproteobacteria bacterium]
MRLLLVEDEPTLSAQLKRRLTDDGFVVDVAFDGPEGEYYGTEFDYEVAIVDLGLPGFDGMELIRRLREADRSFPVLILTARENWQDKVRGLEVGADDYLVKPFHPQELVARINALIRRSAGFASPRLEMGELVLDTSSREVRREGVLLELTAFEYKVLEYLMLHAGAVVSKPELTEQLYDQDFERDSNVIEVFVGRLRKKLAPLTPIRTVRGLGYRFEP